MNFIRWLKRCRSILQNQWTPKPPTKIMKIILFSTTLALAIVTLSFNAIVDMKIERSFTIDSLGACQGISYQQGKLFLYGDRETGVIREYREDADSLVYLGHEMKLTLHDTDVINHPTGIAYHEKDPVFIGNSIRLNKEGTLWKAMIYCVNWQGLQRTGSLDGNLINTIEDDACIQGTRPEYVQYGNKWFVATADYGGKANEVRLYDPALLKKVKRTSEKGVVFKKFTCDPWVQNLHWMADKGILVLIQNQVEGRKWRFAFLDLDKSIRDGKQSVIKVVDLSPENELEGFTFLKDYTRGIAVSSSRRNNATMISVQD
ncbi:MAG: hypothetical protein JWP81_1097 [Ferruginibacter sp.]|nr:hypothetical protein [Ferruginibacter sp.]